MIEPKVPKNEKERLKELESYSILDTLSEEDYDSLTAIAAEICNSPISLVSLVDDKRQWFKSHHGLNATETPKEYAFCAHAINQPEDIFIVKDARSDIRFHDNPLVTGEPYVIFYAGVPIFSEKGLPLGTLCVIDNQPKELTENQIKSLKALSRQVMNLLKLRKRNIQLERANSALKQKNKDLEQFAMTAAHDIKSPLINISSLAQILLKEYALALDSDGQKYLELINSSAEKLSGLVHELLEYSRFDQLISENKKNIKISKLIEGISRLFTVDSHCRIIQSSELTEIKINKTAVEQILINLIGNAIKYNDKALTEIEIGVIDGKNHYEIFVRDNGPGIAVENREKIFEMFKVASKTDKYGKTGNGIGLATVKKIVKGLGGNIRVESETGKGSTFTFVIEK